MDSLEQELAEQLAALDDEGILDDSGSDDEWDLLAEKFRAGVAESEGANDTSVNIPGWDAFLGSVDVMQTKASTDVELTIEDISHLNFDVLSEPNTPAPSTDSVQHQNLPRIPPSVIMAPKRIEDMSEQETMQVKEVLEGLVSAVALAAISPLFWKTEEKEEDIAASNQEDESRSKERQLEKGLDSSQEQGYNAFHVSHGSYVPSIGPKNAEYDIEGIAEEKGWPESSNRMRHGGWEVEKERDDSNSQKDGHVPITSKGRPRKVAFGSWEENENDDTSDGDTGYSLTSLALNQMGGGQAVHEAGLADIGDAFDPLEPLSLEDLGNFKAEDFNEFLGGYASSSQAVKTVQRLMNGVSLENGQNDLERLLNNELPGLAMSKGAAVTKDQDYSVEQGPIFESSHQIQSASDRESKMVAQDIADLELLMVEEEKMEQERKVQMERAKEARKKRREEEERRWEAERQAAVKIQCGYRCFSSRKKLVFLRHLKEKERARERQERFRMADEEKATRNLMALESMAQKEREEQERRRQGEVKQMMVEDALMRQVMEEEKKKQLEEIIAMSKEETLVRRFVSWERNREGEENRLMALEEVLVRKVLFAEKESERERQEQLLMEREEKMSWEREKIARKVMEMKLKEARRQALGIRRVVEQTGMDVACKLFSSSGTKASKKRTSLLPYGDFFENQLVDVVVRLSRSYSQARERLRQQCFSELTRTKQKETNTSFPQPPTSDLWNSRQSDGGDGEGTLCEDMLFHLGNLSQVQSLELNVEGLKDVKILSKFKSLKVLHLNVNRLSTTSHLSQNLNLIQLSLKDNCLRSLNGLQGLSSLTELHLDVNQLTSLDALRSCQSLKILTAHTNGLQEVPKLQGQCPQMQELELYHNKITRVPYDALRGMNSLTSLNLGRNGLTELDGQVLNCCPTLVKLVLSQNSLVAPPAPLLLPILKELWLSGNRISSLEDWVLSSRRASNPGQCWLPSLETLYLQDNALASLHRGSTIGLPLLKTLELSFNQIGSIPDLEPLAACGHLKDLQIHDNPVTVETELETYLLAALPFLEMLDGDPVPPEKKWDAQAEAFQGHAHMILPFLLHHAKVGKQVKTRPKMQNSFWLKKQSYRCLACHAERRSPQQNESNISCTQCGSDISQRPAPPWLDWAEVKSHSLLSQMKSQSSNGDKTLRFADCWGAFEEGCLTARQHLVKLKQRQRMEQRNLWKQTEGDTERSVAEVQLRAQQVDEISEQVSLSLRMVHKINDLSKLTFNFRPGEIEEVNEDAILKLKEARKQRKMLAKVDLVSLRAVETIKRWWDIDCRERRSKRQQASKTIQKLYRSFVFRRRMKHALAGVEYQDDDLDEMMDEFDVDAFLGGAPQELDDKWEFVKVQTANPSKKAPHKSKKPQKSPMPKQSDLLPRAWSPTTVRSGGGLQTEYEHKPLPSRPPSSSQRRAGRMSHRMSRMSRISSTGSSFPIEADQASLHPPEIKIDSRPTTRGLSSQGTARSYISEPLTEMLETDRRTPLGSKASQSTRPPRKVSSQKRAEKAEKERSQLMEEWGFKDERVAAAMLRRNKKIKRFKTQGAHKKQLADTYTKPQSHERERKRAFDREQVSPAETPAEPKVNNRKNETEKKMSTSSRMRTLRNLQQKNKARQKSRRK